MEYMIVLVLPLKALSMMVYRVLSVGDILPSPKAHAG